MTDHRGAREALGLPPPLTQTDTRLDAVLGQLMDLGATLGRIEQILTPATPEPVQSELVQLQEPAVPAKRPRKAAS